MGLRVLIILLPLSYYNSVCFSQDVYSIEKIELTNQPLLKAAEDYILEWQDALEYYGVVVMYCDFDNERYFLSYIMFKDEVVDRPPSFFMQIRKKVVLIYTGFEKNLNFQPKSFDKLFKVANKALAVPPTAISYDPVFWKITFEGNQYVKTVVDSIP